MAHIATMPPVTACEAVHAYLGCHERREIAPAMTIQENTMNKIKTFALAGLMGLAGLTVGFATQAATPGIIQDYKAGSDRAARAASPSDSQGSESGLIIVVKPGELLPAVMPTDQQSAERGSVKTGPGPLTLGSLNSLRSTDQLFSNSRGGDQGNGMLLPAVQKVREAAAHDQGDGSVKPGEAQGLNFANPGETRGLNFTNPGAAKGLNFTNPGSIKGLNFTNSANNAGGGGAPKSLNFTATARR